MATSELQDVVGDRPLVTIITVCRNARQTIRRCIESVLQQDYENIEYIIIDGGSDDGTLDILEEYLESLAYFVSEGDSGISDAFNKGIARARGGFIELLNADDWIPKDKIRRSVMALTQEPRAAFAFGDLYLCHKDGDALLKITGDPGYAKTIDRRMPRINHPTALVRASVYEEHGVFDLRWKIAMDYDWFLRIHRAGEHGVYSAAIKTYMQDGGASSRIVPTLREGREISRKYGLGSAAAYFVYVRILVTTYIRAVLERILPRSTLMRWRPGKSLVSDGGCAFSESTNLPKEDRSSKLSPLTAMRHYQNSHRCPGKPHARIDQASVGKK